MRFFRSTTLRDFVFLLISAAFVALYVGSATPLPTMPAGFPLDDSWIHQVYARNLAEFGEWSFIVGEPSAASTSPLFTVLLTVGYLVGADFRLWVHGIGVIALAVAGMLGARMAERILPQQKVVAGWLTGLGLISAWHLIWAATSGMETMVFSTLTLAVIFLAWRELDYNADDESVEISITNLRRSAGLRGLAFGFVSSLCMLARPEGVVLAGIAGMGVLVMRVSGKKQSNLVVAWVGGAVIGFVFTTTPYLLLNLSLAGSLLPSTASTKWAQHRPLLAQSYPERLSNLVIPIMAGAQVLLTFGALMYVVHAVRKQDTRKVMLICLPILWSISLVALYAARLPASYQHGRYVIPALPAFIFSGIVGTILLLKISQSNMLARVFMRVLVVSCVILYAFFALGLGRSAYVTDVAIIDQEMVTSALWIDENLPEDAVLAIHDIGAVGYFAPRPMVDVAGLLDPEASEIYHDGDAMWAFLEARQPEYFLAFPDQIPNDNTDDPRLCPIFTTNAEVTLEQGGENMTVYRMAWDGVCDGAS